MKNSVRTILATALLSVSAFSQQAKNVILFVGDGGGVTSLNAASILGYGKAQALYIQSMPNVGLADSSTSMQWVTDGAGAASAMATGKKSRNGYVSSQPQGDGAYKTILEHAEEQGLSTGLITNEKDGITYAAISAYYAHTSNRGSALDIYHQFLNPKFGNGPDVVIVTANQKLADAVQAEGKSIAGDLKSKGYSMATSLNELAAMDSSTNRVITMTSDDFDMSAAVKHAVARLSKNPKGFFLVVHSDCHLGKTRASLNRLIELDKAIRAVGDDNKSNTLMIYTADHGYALYIKGETLTETQKSADQKQIINAIHLEDQHTAEEVPVVAVGPGSERVKGFMSNTDVFRIMMAAFGWQNAITSTN